jgi:hypothetical protein
MVDLDALARRARRAAEWGRLRAASRAAFVVAPLVALSTAVTGRAPAALAAGAALLATCVALRFWNAEGARAARSGLCLGALPMAAALATAAAQGWCDPRGAVTACGVGCLLAGLVAGGASAWYVLRHVETGRLASWAKVGLVASLTAALGCVGLGAGAALAVIAAVAAGAALVWLPPRRPA